VIAIQAMSGHTFSQPAYNLTSTSMFTVLKVIRELKVHQQQSEDLHFTRASDIYAFGTVWYELLTGEWPWKEQPPEAIIWQSLPS